MKFNFTNYLLNIMIQNYTPSPYRFWGHTGDRDRHSFPPVKTIFWIRMSIRIGLITSRERNTHWQCNLLTFVTKMVCHCLYSLDNDNMYYTMCIVDRISTICTKCRIAKTKVSITLILDIVPNNRGSDHSTKVPVPVFLITRSRWQYRTVYVKCMFKQNCTCVSFRKTVEQLQNVCLQCQYQKSM